MAAGRATEKQVRFALHLLSKAGYSTRYMDAKFKGLATMRERSGTVENWLAHMNVAEISSLIDKLKAKEDSK